MSATAAVDPEPGTHLDLKSCHGNLGGDSATEGFHNRAAMIALVPGRRNRAIGTHDNSAICRATL